MHRMDEGHIGVDESGKGDFFGPLVIAACYVGPEHLAKLEGVRDSKSLTDKRALALSVAIKNACPHVVISIGPAKYNELYEKIRNLNKLLEWGHARAIEDLLGKVSAKKVISDQFANPAGLKRRLFEKGRQVELVSVVRAEADIAVAAASVLARAEFLRRLESLGRDLGCTLPKGASTPVLDAARSIVRTQGVDALKSVCKVHFKTFGQVVGP